MYSLFLVAFWIGAIAAEKEDQAVPMNLKDKSYTMFAIACEPMLSDSPTIRSFSRITAELSGNVITISGSDAPNKNKVLATVQPTCLIHSLVISRDASKIAASCQDSSILTYTLTPSPLSYNPTQHLPNQPSSSPLTSLSISPDGTSLACGHTNGMVSIWRQHHNTNYVLSNTFQASQSEITALFLDSTRIFSAGGAGKAIHIG